VAEGILDQFELVKEGGELSLWTSIKYLEEHGVWVVLDTGEESTTGYSSITPLGDHTVDGTPTSLVATGTTATFSGQEQTRHSFATDGATTIRLSDSDGSSSRLLDGQITPSKPPHGPATKREPQERSLIGAALAVGVEEELEVVAVEEAAGGVGIGGEGG